MGRIPNEIIVKCLQSGESQDVDEMLSYLHRQVYSMASRFIVRYKGSAQDAEDIFQDGLLALYKLARQGKLASHINIEAYLFSICKNLWFRQLHKNRDTIELTTEFNGLTDPEVIPIFTLLSEERKLAVEKLLRHIGEDCQKVLVAYFYDRIRMVKIAEMMGYATEQVAKNKKSECMKKLKNLILEAPIFFRNLKEK